jgi:hypothetical protein
MKPRTGAIVVALVCFAATFLLTGVVWPYAEGGPQPSGVQLPLFIILGVLDSLAFGVGVAFLLYGYPLVRRLGQGRLAWATYLSIAWSLVSWWPHSNMHRVNGENIAGLLAIDYGFHATLMLATYIVLRFFWIAAHRAAPAAREATATSPVLATA